MLIILLLSGGPYKFFQGQKYLVALRKLELQARKELEGAFENLEEYWSECSKPPQDTILHIKFNDDPGEFWNDNEDEFGRFPSSGAILIGTFDFSSKSAKKPFINTIFFYKGCEVPSSNKSLLDKKNHKQTWILLSQERQDLLNYKGPLK